MSGDYSHNHTITLPTSYSKTDTNIKGDTHSDSKNKKTRKWQTVILPVSLREKIKEEAKREGKAMWQIIAEGLECREREKTKNWARKATNDLDRTAYYIMKLMTAVERFKIAPSLENLEWVEKTASQIKQRLGVDVSYVVNAAKRYHRTKDKKDLVDLNMMAKMAIAELIEKSLLGQGS